MNIATIGIKYPQKRLVLDNQIEGVKYYSFQNWTNPIQKQILHTYEIYKPIFQNNIDGYHVINTIMLTNKPWCCSFETMLPRGRQFLHINHKDHFELKKGWYMEKLLKILAKDNCKQLIAFSDCNLMMQNLVYNEFGRLGDILRQKTKKINVPQILYIDKPKEIINEKVHFLFIGNDFVRKGGQEMILALSKVRKARDDFRATIITKTRNIHNYAFEQFQDTKEEIKSVLAIAENSKDWLNIYPHLPFNNILELLKKCDVGLLPTWADTYGYSILEMQACGMPVISTNVRALRETNQNGWMINLPINWAGELSIKKRSEKNDIRKLIVDKLAEIIDQILDNKSEIISKGKASYNFIKKNHSPLEYSNKIRMIYNTF